MKNFLLIFEQYVYLYAIDFCNNQLSIIFISQRNKTMGCINLNLGNKGQQLNQQNNIQANLVNQQKLEKKQNIKEVAQQKLLKNQECSINKSKLQEDNILSSSKNNQIQQIDLFILKELALIQKDLFASNIYLWIDLNINNPQIQNAYLLLKKQGFDINLYQNIGEAKNSVANNKNNSRFRVITSATMAEAVCKQFKSNQKVVHIYIYGGQKSVGQALKKKERKIKFCTVSEEQFIQKIKQQSRYDNKFIDLPNFLKITNKNNDQDNTMINKSRYNLHGLLRFTNRVQAKQDFVKFVKYFYSIEDKAFKYEMEQFQNQYPVELDHKLALNWYTRPTFFYGFLNNMLRSTNNPLQTSYLRHPFESTFKAIKTLYDQTQKRSFKVYRGGFINNEQLKYLEQNVGQYIQMYGFVSTSEDYTVAESFRQRYNGNSLMTVLIQDQDRQAMIDYGYVSLVEYSDLPSEKQVLFNSLNVFKIVEYKIQDGINKVTLKYGQLARMVKLGLDKVPQKQKNIIYNYKHQQEIISQKIKNQADIFKQCQMYDNQIEYRGKWMLENKGKQNIEFAIQLHKLGKAYHYKAEYDKALQQLQRSLKIKINILGDNHISIANTFNFMGIVYRKKAEYDRALQYYQKSLKIEKNCFGDNHISIADTLNNIGLIYSNTNKYNKALQCYQESLKITINVLGDNHISTADTLNNIGLVYEQLEKIDKALQNYQRSLKITINLLGMNHSSTADTLDNIGTLYRKKADYDKALQQYQSALKIKLNIFGQNHNSTADTLNNIGTVFLNKADYDKALQQYQRALKINLNIFGQNHNGTADTLYNIAQVYDCTTEYDKALQHYQRSHKISRNILGQNHITNADTLDKMGLVYKNKKEYNNAIQCFQKSLKIKLYNLGQEHISTADTLQDLALVTFIQQNYLMAESYYMRCYKIRLKKFGPDHELTMQALNGLNDCQGE